jgi:hypothetical protein
MDFADEANMVPPDPENQPVDGKKAISIVFMPNFSFPFSIDTITALEYNITGDFLATGDRNGRITVLRLDNKTEVRIYYIKLCKDFLQMVVK